MREFTAVFKQEEGWWIDWVEELPGAFGQGRELGDARESLREAITLILDELPEESG
jgi:predicted RNase H-like HicB family nuclease